MNHFQNKKQNKNKADTAANGSNYKGNGFSKSNIPLFVFCLEKHIKVNWQIVLGNIIFKKEAVYNKELKLSILPYLDEVTSKQWSIN